MKNIVKIIALFAIIPAFWSCEKQLNALPANERVGDNIIFDSKSAEVALNGVYYMYASCGLDWYDVPSVKVALYQELLPSIFWGVLKHNQGGMLLPSSITASTSEVELMWFYYYGIVNAANGVIKQMNEKPDIQFSGNRRNEIQGEAALMRAFGNYFLLRTFARHFDYDSPEGVLLRDQPINVDNMAKARGTVKDSYQAIIDDIDFAIGNCPETSQKYYTNQWVAKGLKVRVLMMRGQTGDYAAAAGLALDIIENSPYTLEDHLQDLFRTKGLTSNEVMFGIMPKDNQTDKATAYFTMSRNEAQYNPTDLLRGLLAGDPRESWYMTTLPPTTYLPDNILISKYLDGTTLAVNSIEETNYQMRLTEIYLLRAEALVRSGGSTAEAKQRVKEVMGKAGVTDFSAIDNASTDDDLLLEITKEAIRNLCCEAGVEAGFMSRLPLTTLQVLIPGLLSMDYTIMPIPAAEFRSNPTIGAQNSGYGKI